MVNSDLVAVNNNSTMVRNGLILVNSVSWSAVVPECNAGWSCQWRGAKSPETDNIRHRIDNAGKSLDTESTRQRHHKALSS